MSNKLKNAIHGYIVLDSVSWDENDWSEFNKIKSNYFLEFCECNTVDNRTMYYLAMRDSSLLYDQEVETETGTATKYGVLSLFYDRNQEVIGVWNKDGSEFGTEIKVTPAVYDESGELLEAEIEEIIGSPKYSFTKDKYVSYIEPRINVDEDGNEVSRVEFYDVCNFAGFSKRGFE